MDGKGYTTPTDSPSMTLRIDFLGATKLWKWGEQEKLGLHILCSIQVTMVSQIAQTTPNCSDY